MRREAGFTLIEVLVAMSLAAILVTLGAFSMRQYWLVRSLDQAGGEVSSQLRLLQQQAASESSPLIYGARFRPGTSVWSTLRYSLGENSADPADDSCSVQSNLTLSTNVRVLSTSTFATSTQVSQSQLAGGCAVLSGDRVVLFFPKGTATKGHVDLHQPSLNRSAAVCVSAITARVSPVSIEASTSC